MDDPKRIERVALSSIKEQAEQLEVLEQSERVLAANEQLAYHELHKLLAGQAERDLAVTRMQVAHDKLSSVVLALIDRQEVDSTQIETLTIARREMQYEIDRLRADAAAIHARQDVIAAVLDVYSRHIADIGKKV